jgi:hypothetical protein
MASGSDDADEAADRLEAALERIAQAVPRGPLPAADHIRSPEVQEIATRLDGLIDRLRKALGRSAD